MAAATVAGLGRPHVFGDKRARFASSIAFASNGDTWTVPGVKNVNVILLTPTTNTAFGFTKSGNVITLVSGGALTFSGGAIGL